MHLEILAIRVNIQLECKIDLNCVCNMIRYILI